MEGKSLRQVARDLDLTESALRLWGEQTKTDQGEGKPGSLTSKTSPCPVVTDRAAHETSVGHTPGGGPWSWRRSWSSSARKRSG
ncbi:hypothetical protein [Myxococcus faecalis]|uniref:hypothetical protein n=1 Tax=Myxococcus faecalis TaxID=3115646 RepID=UPI003CF43F02